MTPFSLKGPMREFKAGERWIKASDRKFDLNDSVIGVNRATPLRMGRNSIKYFVSPVYQCPAIKAGSQKFIAPWDFQFLRVIYLNDATVYIRL